MGVRALRKAFVGGQQDDVSSRESRLVGKRRASEETAEIMTTILPGERVPTAHVNLKLGPGLSQITKSNSIPLDKSGKDKPHIIGTKAGELKQSTNGSKWWVDNNSRRVSQTITTTLAC